MNTLKSCRGLLALGLVLCTAAARADLVAVAETAPQATATAEPVAPGSVAVAQAADSGLREFGAASASASLFSGNLWAFITSVRAQQQGNSFVLLESNLSLVQGAEPQPPSQVPLPGAIWFLVMGLLGMAGVRLTGRGAAPAAAERQPRPAVQGAAA